MPSCAASSVLVATPRLRWLARAGMSAAEPCHAPLVTAAAQHPTLQHLRLHCAYDERLDLSKSLPGFERVLEQAMRHKPALTYETANGFWLSRMASFEGSMAECEEDC